MGRTLPYECPHGITVDWGDFGPCQNCDLHRGEGCPNLEHCDRCQSDYDQERMDWALEHLRANGMVVVACPPGGRVVVDRTEKPCDCPVMSGEGAWREAHDPECASVVEAATTYGLAEATDEDVAFYKSTVINRRTNEPAYLLVALPEDGE